MKKYFLLNFLLSYLWNTLFLFTYTKVFGKIDPDRIDRFILGSFFYVAPATVIQFIVTGIAMTYCLVSILNQKGGLAVAAVTFLIICNLVMYSFFYNNWTLSFCAIRFVVDVLFSASLFIIYFRLKKNSSPD